MNFCFALLFNAVLLDAINIQHHVATNFTSNAYIEKIDYDCDVLPRSMNGGKFEKGCPGAVWSSGAYSSYYCAGSNYPWWAACCKWENEKCVPKQSVPKQKYTIPDIVYKYSDHYDLIWNDKGTLGVDGAIWKIRNYDNNFCSLGDVATSSYETPRSKGVLVSAIKSGVLTEPTSFSIVWDDSGSWVADDVAVYRMNAPPGYTCLGAVAIDNYSGQPNSSEYCCVKNDYIVQADTLEIYNDKHTGSSKNGSLWAVMQKGGEVNGVYGGNFIVVNGYSQPGSAYLLQQGNKVKDVWSVPLGKTKELNLYESSQMRNIWDDAGSLASTDVSVWRSEAKPGYFPVGDVVVATHDKPTIGFLLRPSVSDDDSLRTPVSYDFIWNDKGSVASRDVTIWQVNCPPAYVALGGVATNGSYPQVGDIYCVKVEYTTYGTSWNWALTWKDRGSWASKDVSIFEARADETQQSVRGFGAVANHQLYPKAPFLLKKDNVNYWAEKPIEKIYMDNVWYNLIDEKQQAAPTELSPTIVENNSSQTQTVKRRIKYSFTETKSFTFSHSIVVGMSLQIEAKVPIIGGTSTTLSTATTSTFQTGSSSTETNSDELEAAITVPGNSKITVWVEGTEYKSDIPFTATIKKVYYDGTYAMAQVSGVYKGVRFAQFNVKYGNMEEM